MCNVPEIEFTQEEFLFLKDHQFFDVKASIISKVIQLFSRIEETIETEIKTTSFKFPERVSTTPSKISKGENYLECPYIVLDYPRLYSKDDIFAFRTIFWWGHYFSNALILGGRSYHRYLPRFLEITGELKKKNWELCIYRTPWKLENLPWNYVQFSDLSDQEIKIHLQKYQFIKITRIYPLDQYKKLEWETLHFFSDLIYLMA